MAKARKRSITLRSRSTGRKMTLKYQNGKKQKVKTLTVPNRNGSKTVIKTITTYNVGAKKRAARKTKSRRKRGY